MFLKTYFSTDEITFLAASSRSEANWISKPDSSKSFLPAETFVPKKKFQNKT
jgi:hypothetical protein